MTEYITKDSGARAQFESGMQRDLEDGKPRFDLMLPLGVPYEEQMITRLAALYGRGAVKYEDRNWEQATVDGPEFERFKSSAFRHFMQWMAGEEDEDHAAGAMFNMIGWETTKYKGEHRPIDFDEIADQILGVQSDLEVRDETVTIDEVEAEPAYVACDASIPSSKCPGTKCVRRRARQAD